MNHTNANENSKKVMILITNVPLLESFYKQPVFMDTAQEAMDEITNGVRGFFSQLSSTI